MSGNAWREVREYNTLPAIDAILADYLKPMVLLTLNTGLKGGEAFNLCWPDIDFQRNQLSVEGTTAKSGQTRRIPLNTEVQAIFKSWGEQSDTEYIFASPVTRERFDKIKRSWGALRARAGLPDFWSHELRHTFASKLVMSGQDLYLVKELLGQPTIQMTERYAHLTPDHKISAVEMLVTK